MPGQITMENVEKAFGSVQSIDEDTIKAMDLITERFTALAKDVIAHVPNCAHRSAALRDVLQAKMMCIDAIIKGGLI